MPTCFYPRLAAIKVNGKVLADAGSFGDNGFYLPFDPDAVGQNYSQFLSSDSGQYRSGNTPEKAFDGDSTSICESATEGTSSQIIFDPPNGLFTGEINIKLGAPVNISAVAIDGGGGSNTLTSTNTTNVWEGTVNGLQSITLTITVPNGYCDLRFLEINGKVLVDHNNIGVDASGINNHFYDENFAVGNTSQVWSNLVSFPDGQYSAGTVCFASPTYSFNGSVLTEYVLQTLVLLILLISTALKLTLVAHHYQENLSGMYVGFTNLQQSYRSYR